READRLTLAAGVIAASDLSLAKLALNHCAVVINVCRLPQADQVVLYAPLAHLLGEQHALYLALRFPLAAVCNRAALHAQNVDGVFGAYRCAHGANRECECCTDGAITLAQASVSGNAGERLRRGDLNVG